jgi:L-2-hydroxycarboxylate dehydrogenase (NAD+)
MELAVKKAQKKGMALVGMYNMHSYLIPGYYAKMASDRGLIGAVIDNARSSVAPYGGINPRMGTNPIGLAVPTDDISLVIDMATATRAMGEVRLAKELGEQLPEGMAIDKNGAPTRNPDSVHALTAMGAYKGYALALAIEIMAGSFVRAKMGSQMKEKLDRGFLFMAIDPTIFVSLNEFKSEVDAFLKEVKGSRLAPGFKEILIPGERAARCMKDTLDRGYVEIDEKTIDDINAFL